MKNHRKDFKTIVSQLYLENVVKELSNCTDIEVARNIWHRIVAKYKIRCRTWKNKYYFVLESEWVYPRSKKLKVSDYPIEICILIRLMNVEKDGREIYDNEVVFEEDDLAARLRETGLKAGQNLAEYIKDGEFICEMSEDKFLEMFI